MGNLYTSLFTVDECPLVGLILRMSASMNARLDEHPFHHKHKS
jgi:hypothetical protein